MMRIPALILFAALLVAVVPDSQADMSCSERITIGAAYAEIRGHIWAIEANIDRSLEPSFEHDQTGHIPNHGSHPIAEVYPEIAATLGNDATGQLQSELDSLYAHAKDPENTAALLDAVSSAKSEVDSMRALTLGSVGDDVMLQAAVISSLTTLSADEYDEAIKNGQLLFAVELQDAYAFQRISQKLFKEISSEYSASERAEIDNILKEIDTIYDDRRDPAESTTLAESLATKLGSIVRSSELDSHECDYFADDIMDYDTTRTITDKEKRVALEHVASIRSLLLEAKSVYDADPDLAFDLVQEAYIDHFEYIEDDIKAAGHEELNENVEYAIRDDLIGAILSYDPRVPQMIDDVLVSLDIVEQVVPEFGSLALAVLVVTTVAVIAVTARSGLFAPTRQA